MSGFDFGSLRDPDAPQPDSRHRDGVEMRAHQLRAKARRNRTIVSALALLLVVGVVTGIVATRPDSGPSIQVTNPSSTTTVPAPSSSVGARFVPPTTTKNGITTLPVTFPDGETTTLRYPPAMKIAQLGFRGDIGVEYPVTNGALHCCGKVVSITYQTIADVYGDATPVHVYRGANGESVPYFHASQSRNPINATKQDYLAFQFGPWLVQVYDVQHSGDFEQRMTETQRETWARKLTGTLDPNGYLVLHTQGPLSIDHGQESGFGSEPGNVVELDPHLYCDGPESDSSARRRGTGGGTHGVSWCVDKEMHVSAHGTAPFADLAFSGLKVDPLGTPLTSPPSTSTTTTTTTPTPTNAPAASASFVSPTHGWVLQSNGALAETTDGGLSWKAESVRSFDLPADFVTAQIRFADSKRGFVRIDRNLFTTDDDGAHWQHLATPSGPVADLAISRGAVYVVAYDVKANDFALWSSPTDHLAWSKDPLTLPVGAGPVPVQQLVFSGGNGWVMDEDRTVIGGGRLSSSGQWATWKPPCLDVVGPARLAASSSTDLVASCNDHEWGGGTAVPAVYFSHDAGKSFQRRTAPAFGEIASPNATTAVVEANGVLRRTTDEGVTWTEVAREPLSHALDLGFTTATQGFVVFSDGKMLMTYDAGATWSAVTLP